MVTSSFELILAQMKQLEKGLKAEPVIVNGHNRNVSPFRGDSQLNYPDQASSL